MLDFSAQGLKATISHWVARIGRLKELFSTSKDVYGNLLGIDLDDSSLITILLRNPLGRAISVSRAEVIGLEPGVIVEDTVIDNTQLVAALKKMIERGHIPAMNAVIGMPGSKVVIKQIKLDALLSDEEAESRAWQEARKTFPEIVKNLFLDFAQVEQFSSGKNKKYLLVIVAVRKEDVTPRVESLQNAGLMTKIVEVDYYALERAYQLFASQLPEDHAASHVALIDFNPHSILFVVMHRKKAVYNNRQIYAGDVLIPIVQRVMGFEVASLKPKPVFVPPLRLTPMQTDISKKSESQESLSEITEDQKTHMVMSIRRLFQSFYAENTGRVITHIVITGRCALISELTDYIGKTLDIPLVVGNPLATLKMGEHVDAERILKLGPAFALSCGLSMRGIPVWI